MKTYPLEIEKICGDDPSWFSKGIHKPSDFLEALRAYFGEEDWKGMDADVANVGYGLMRCNPTGDPEFREFSHWFESVRSPGPGVFKITMHCFNRWDRNYCNMDRATCMSFHFGGAEGGP